VIGTLEEKIDLKIIHQGEVLVPKKYFFPLETEKTGSLSPSLNINEKREKIFISNLLERK